jgi:hypothetical protein
MSTPQDFPEHDRIEVRLSHPCFPQPSNKAIPVWRYMDIAKLVSMLTSKAIYLTRIDRFSDPYEGTTTSNAAAGIAQFLKAVDSANDASHVLKMIDTARSELFVSCWHANEHESEAMWRLYCGDAGGVAIQSTYLSLLEAIRWHAGVYIGAVRYIDYKTTAFPDANAYYPAMHKRASFMHEREVRLVKLHPLPIQGEQDVEMSIPVDLDRLCKAIYVAPSAPGYYFDAVKAIVNAIAPELATKLRWSEMSAPPFRPPG